MARLRGLPLCQRFGRAVRTFHLAERERVGLVKGENGELFAVAGRTRCCWPRALLLALTPDSEPSLAHTSALALRDTVSAACFTAGVICMFP